MRRNSFGQIFACKMFNLVFSQLQFTIHISGCHTIVKKGKARRKYSNRDLDHLPKKFHDVVTQCLKKN